MSLLVILSTYAMEDGQTATSVPHHHTKYKKADLKTVCQSQTELTVEEKSQLEVLLRKCEPLFDGQLGHWQGQEVKLELKEGAKPYHSRAYNIPRCHM